MRSPLYPTIIHRKLNAPPGMSVSIIHRADSQFPFLHDTMVVKFGEKLLVAWYHCTEDEIVGETSIRGIWSHNQGKTWSKIETIAYDHTGQGIHYVPVSFSVEGENIWAYVTKMRAHDEPIGYVVYKYDDINWIRKDERDDPILINTIPQKLTDNRIIVGGRMALNPGEKPLIPIIAQSEIYKNEPAKWEITKLLGPWNHDEFKLQCPETAVAVNNDSIHVYVRNDVGPAQYYHSEDFGNEWNGPYDCLLPIGRSKIYAGCLPNGKIYLVYNELNSKLDRSQLVLSIQEELNSNYYISYVLRNGYDSSLCAGPYWHYPCVAVDENYMFISCTTSSNSVYRNAALISVPLAEII